MTAEERVNARRNLLNSLKKIRPKKCIDCGIDWADFPSKLCPGCYAYKEHTEF